MLKRIKEEFLRFTDSERLFILFAMLCGFFISAEYAVIRPVSNAVFLTAYTTEFLPYVWLSAVPLNFLVVALYNRYLPQFGCFKMFLTTAGAIVGGNLFCAVFMNQIPFLPFIFYLWKEIYVLLMFQQLWSVIHSTIKADRAKYLYGLIFAVGGLGGFLGSLLPGFLAVKIGSENLLFASFPLYLLLSGAYFFMLKHTETLPKNRWDASTGSWQEGLTLIKNSKLLLFILWIVIFMQLSSTFVYYQFNTVLEATVGDKDLRTEYAGRIFGIANMFTVGLQLFGSFVLVHFLGLRSSHIFVPCALCINAVCCLFFPTFPMISYAYVTIKAFDFSIFGIIKEMLYIPLKINEKFHAKAIIDVFVYRTAKAFASVLIIFFQFLHAPLSFLSWGSIILFLVWSLTVMRIYRVEEETLA